MDNNKKVKYTKEEKRLFKKKNKVISTFSSIIVGMFLVCAVYFVLNLLKLTGIEPVIRYIIIGLLIMFCLYIIRENFKLRYQPKKYKFIIFIIVLIGFGFGLMYVAKYISKGINIVDNFNKSNNKVTYTSALIALNDTDINKDNITNAKIGIITDTEKLEEYELAQEIIKKNNIPKDNLVKYDSDILMMNDLYDGYINAAFVSGGYASLYSGIEKFENIASEVKVVDKYSKKMKKQEKDIVKESNKSVLEPFTMLLLGVDSTEENIEDAVALGDTIIVVTFNPNTLNATLFSIPRDTYVPITCYGDAMSKITHAASGGDSCMISTVENFIGIDIDYYAKINFRGLINLVDALGGIYVDVPYSFCETNENRNFVNPIVVRKGYQKLSGREALGLARNRKYYPTCGEEWNEGERSDFVRGQNQQLVLKGIINKAKQIRTVDEFYNVLDTISRSLDTNLTREQILGFYNVFKKVLLSTDSLTDSNDVISIQRTYLNGGGGIIYDYVAGMGLYEFVPSNNGLKAIVKAMKINLGLEEEEYDKSFEFSIDTPYEPEIIGADIYGGVASYPTVNTSDESTEQKSDTTCNASENRELGADMKTCVCKNGYKEDSSGKCVKKEVKCDTNEELGADGVTCLCKSGYTRNDDDECVSEDEEPTDPTVVPDDPDTPDDPAPDEPDTPTDPEPEEPSGGEDPTP